MSNNGLSQFLVHVECLNLFRRVIGQLKFAEQFNGKLWCHVQIELLN